MFVFRKFLVSKHFMDKGGDGYRDFQSNFFVSQYRNLSLRNLSVLCFRKLQVAKKFVNNRGRESIKVLP